MNGSQKGQFQHVFTFIMLILIAGVVLILGYSFVNKLLSSGCEAETLSFRQTIEEVVRDYSSYGTFQRPVIDAPCNARAVCFVDARAFTDNNNDGQYDENPQTAFTTSYAAIKTEVQYPSTTPSNVFLIDKDGVTEPLQLFSKKVGLEESNKALCVNATSGAFRMVMQGRGRTVLIRAQE